MFKDNQIRVSARLTIVKGTAHRAHGARAARSGNGLAGAMCVCVCVCIQVYVYIYMQGVMNIRPHSLRAGRMD